MVWRRLALLSWGRLEIEFNHIFFKLAAILG